MDMTCAHGIRQGCFPDGRGGEGRGRKKGRTKKVLGVRLRGPTATKQCCRATPSRYTLQAVLDRVPLTVLQLLR